MDSIQVTRLTKQNDDELTGFLDDLAAASPSVLAYHYPFYRDMLEKIGIGSPCYYGARIRNKLVGVLPAFVRRSSLGSTYCSLPFFGPNGGVLCRQDMDAPMVHKALLKIFLNNARQDNALSCSVYTPLLFEKFAYYDQAIPNPVMVDKFTQHLNIRTACWSKKIDYDLNRSRRLGVRVSKRATPERIDTFYSIYLENCHDYGIPVKPRQCVEMLTEKSLLGRHSEIYFAFHEEKMIAGLLVLFSPRTASYYIPCTTAAAKSLQPGTLLIDHAVQDALDKGIEIWNWESSPSKDSGVYKFKKKWGSTTSSYRIYVHLFREKRFFEKIGPSELAKMFPYFYVCPFSLL